MKVNIFKYHNSKRQRSFSKQKSDSNNSLNMIELQEPSNDYCKPISVFNSQRKSQQVYYEQSKFQQVEIKDSISKKHGHVIINNKLEEQIIDQSTKFNIKDSSSSMMNTKKISAEFTNDDSAGYNYSKEIMIAPNIDDGTNTTFFSMISSHASTEDKTTNKKNISTTCTTSIINGEISNATANVIVNNKKCDCPHRHSVGLNTKELIRITNQRKALLNKIEQKNKGEIIRHSNSYESIVECSSKDLQEKNQVNKSDHNKDNDNTLSHKSNNNYNDDSLDIPLMLSPSSKQFTSNVLMSESANQDISKDIFNVAHIDSNDNNDIDALEFKIEQRYEEVGGAEREKGLQGDLTSNKNESFSEEKLLSQNEPYNATITTQKELETEINEFDIDRNRMQNETKIMSSIDIDTSHLGNYDSNPILNNIPMPISFNYQEELTKENYNSNNKENEYSKYLISTKPQSQPHSTRYENDTFQKINFFEETLQKIQHNKDSHKVVINDSITNHSNNNDSKRINHDNNRYDKKPIFTNIKKDLMIPHPALITRFSTKPRLTSIEAYINAENLPIGKQSSSNQNKNQIKHNPKVLEDNPRQIKKQRQLKNYSDKYIKKNNNDSNVLEMPLQTPNNPLIKRPTQKAKTHSCCDVNELLPITNDPNNIPKINSHRSKHNYNISNINNTRNCKLKKQSNPSNSAKTNNEQYHCFNSRINFGQKAKKNKEVIYDSLDIL